MAFPKLRKFIGQLPPTPAQRENTTPKNNSEKINTPAYAERRKGLIYGKTELDKHATETQGRSSEDQESEQ